MKANVRNGQSLNKKAFTLIELLAVIVILAIIALIAVPIIVNIIRDTKEKAIKINAQNYMDAVELAVADGHMVKGEKVLISGTYDIIENGKVIKLIKDENDKPILEEKDQIKLSVKYTGEGLKSGTVKLIDGKVRGLTGVKTNEGHDILIILGEVKIIKDSKPVTLTTGKSFNSKIKTLVSGTETKYDATDNIVKSIEFLGYGIIPSGYTLEEFQKLERVDVSANQDETIYAIYNGKEKVYIYAEDKILFNKDSSWMFSNFKAVETIEFGEYVNTSQVTNMGVMFKDCKKLIEVDVNNFDTSQVTSMGSMFYGCSSLTSIDVSNFDTSKVTTMDWMFFSCRKLENIDVSNWVTNNVNNFYNIFHSCDSLTELDVSNWNTSSATNMQGMFAACDKIVYLDVSGFNTSKVTNMNSMFYECNGLTLIDVSKFDTSNVKKMGMMFFRCRNLKELDLSAWNTSKVTDMSNMFSGCDLLIELNLRNFDTLNVTNMSGMFTNCLSLTSLDISNFNTIKVTDMSNMFKRCKQLLKLDISSFDTSNVTDMDAMFYETSVLKPIYVGEKWITEQAVVDDIFGFSATKSLEELCEPNSTESWCVITG